MYAAALQKQANRLNIGTSISNTLKPDPKKPFHIEKSLLRRKDYQVPQHALSSLCIPVVKMPPTYGGNFQNNIAAVSILNSTSRNLVVVNCYSTQVDKGKSEEKPTQILFPKEVDLSKLTFGEQKAYKKGGKYISVMYNNNRFRIQTPPMRIPFGIRRMEDNQRVNYDLSLSFDDLNSPQMKEFYDLMVKYDETIMSRAVSSSWLDKKGNQELTPEIAKFSYKSSIKKMDKTPHQYPPLFNCRIQTDQMTGGPTLVVFQDKIKVPLESLTANSKIVSILELTSLWFVGNGFGSTWHIIQCKIVEKGAPRLEQLTEFSLRDTQ